MVKRAVLALSLILACTLASCIPAVGQRHTSDIAVAVENHSTPTLCAEEDNVDLRLTSTAVRSFHIQARHPAYLDSLAVDSTAPDFTDCHAASPDPGNPGKTYAPRREVLASSPSWEIVGITYPSFWREPVPVWIGEREFDDVHLIQIWTHGRGRDEEVLVLYPPDGYWRARPLAPAGLLGAPDAPATAYGSSFLVGPIEVWERPYVAIDRVAIDPASATVVLDLHASGRATLRIASLDDRQITVDATLSEGAGTAPFAALRSMFVSDTNADAAEVEWREGDGTMGRKPILAFPGARITSLTAERTTPGRHNTSAPDVTVSGFSADRVQR